MEKETSPDCKRLINYWMRYRNGRIKGNKFYIGFSETLPNTITIIDKEKFMVGDSSYPQKFSLVLSGWVRDYNGEF